MRWRNRFRGKRLWLSSWACQHARWLAQSKKNWRSRPVRANRLIFDRGEAGEHFFRLGQRLQRNAVANLEKSVPEGEDVWVFVRGLDRFTRFPFRHFNDG